MHRLHHNNINRNKITFFSRYFSYELINLLWNGSQQAVSTIKRNTVLSTIHERQLIVANKWFLGGKQYRSCSNSLCNRSESLDAGDLTVYSTNIWPQSDLVFVIEPIYEIDDIYCSVLWMVFIHWPITRTLITCTILGIDIQSREYAINHSLDTHLNMYWFIWFI